MPRPASAPSGLAGQLRRLGSETRVYGLSTILGRFLSYLLQPFYVSQFTTRTSGVQTDVYVWIPLVAVLMVMGLDVAYMRGAAWLAGLRIADSG